MGVWEAGNELVNYLKEKKSKSNAANDVYLIKHEVLERRVAALYKRINNVQSAVQESWRAFLNLASQFHCIVLWIFLH